MKLEHKKLGVEVVLPDVVTGEVYTRYWTARIENAAPVLENGLSNPGDVLKEQLAGVLTIAESATVEVNGERRPLGMDVDFKALRWATRAVDNWLANETTVPKD